MTSRSIVTDGNLTHLLGDGSKVPDHSAIVFELRTKYKPILRNDYFINAPKRYNLKSIPNGFMSSDLFKLALQTIITRIESARETQGEIDVIYENLCEVIVSEMNASIPIFDTSKRSMKHFKSTKPYWNGELKGLWNAMHDTETRFLRFHRNNAAKSRLRTEVLSAQKNFDLKLRQAERSYRQSFCSVIETMTTETPNEFWQKNKKNRSSKVCRNTYGNLRSKW